jgi:hypothetical protein
MKCKDDAASLTVLLAVAVSRILDVFDILRDQRDETESMTQEFVWEDRGIRFNLD